jgi:hypothetical protein
LRARRGAVELVGEHHIREDRSFSEEERAGGAVGDVASNDVRRQEIRGQLNAIHRSADHSGERAGERRFSYAGNVFEQHVTAGEESDQGEADDFVLAPDDRSNAAHRRLQSERLHFVMGVGPLLRERVHLSGSTLRASFHVRGRDCYTPAMSNVTRVRSLR